MDWERYHRLGTVYTWLEQLAASHPDTLTLHVIGLTGQGRKIVVAQVGTGGPNKPALFLEGGIHARVGEE